MSDLVQIVKARYVRGIVPDHLNERVAGALGAAFARSGAVVVAHDMGESGPGLAIHATDTAADIARGIDATEARTRTDVPIARVIYLEPHLHRAKSV